MSEALAEAVLKAFGGPEAFVQRLEELFWEAKPGSLTRLRVMEMLLEIGKGKA